MSHSNYDPQEIQHFSALADQWWDINGPFKTLHDINKTRMDFILQHTPLAQKTVLDVGCGGGILAEAMALQGAVVSGIDLDPIAIETARQHSASQGLTLHYETIAAETLAERLTPQGPLFDVVTCLEMLEHVPDPEAIIRACSQLVKPDGHVFFSTINRTLKAYGLAVLGAEYLLKLLPRGTHDYAKFLRPSELLTFASAAELNVTDIKGLHYNPFNGQSTLTSEIAVNYLMACTK